MRRNANIRIKSCSVEVYGVIYVNGSLDKSNIRILFDLSQDPLRYITPYTSTEQDLILTLN